MEPSTKPVDVTIWRERAACRDAGQEMVDVAEQDILLAKKICADCPVVSRCFAYAEQLTEACGWAAVQGVWGGLTQRERGTLAVLGQPPATCPGCGLICVPVSHATDRCEVCDPETSLSYLDYREKIMDLVARGRTFEQVAAALRLPHTGVTSACYRWRVKPSADARPGRRPSKPCGTLAAKTRHARHGESWQNCACKHVAWKRGCRGRRPRPPKM